MLGIGHQFRDVARQLLQRHSSRKTLRVDDEYDAQDVVHALLRLFFDNVVEELVTPFYAGGSTRIDVVLPRYRLGVELKITRPGLRDHPVAGQLIEERDRYEAEPNIVHLLCLAFDVEGVLADPRGLEQDLSCTTSLEGLAVTVKIFSR